MEKASLLVFIPSKYSVLSALPSFPLESVCELWDLVDGGKDMACESFYRSGTAAQLQQSSALKGLWDTKTLNSGLS